MTQVSFYTLSSNDEPSRLLLACRLTEKARSLGHGIFIWAESTEQAQQLDALLWQFKAGSFLPHSVLETEHPDGEAIAIGTARQLEYHSDVLINLSEAACHAHQRFSRISEIVDADKQSLKTGRERYRYYQSEGYSPQTHKL